MSKKIIIKNKIDYFNKVINVSGDKSISIRWVLFSSLAKGVSTAKNLLLSEDVLAAIKTIRKLGKLYHPICHLNLMIVGTTKLIRIMM